MFASIIFYFVMGATICVPGDYSTIQGAINASSAYDYIEVDGGTYNECITVDDHALTICAPDGPFSTEIDGGQSGSVVTMTKDCTLDGFTITNGAGTWNLPSGLTGGGVFIENAEVYIRRCWINENECVAEDRSNTGVGGGVWCRNGTAHLQSCWITNNSVDLKGGGIAAGMADVFLHCTTVADNEAYTGGGAYFSTYCDAEARNAIFWDNEDTGGGAPQIMVRSTSTLDIDYATVESGQSGLIVDGSSTLTWGNSIQTSDPLFTSNYHLSVRSPCIHAGNNSYAYPTTDIDGDRRAYLTVDHGGDEWVTTGVPMERQQTPPRKAKQSIIDNQEAASGLPEIRRRDDDC